jgi:hypothetical protein
VCSGGARHHDPQPCDLETLLKGFNRAYNARRQRVLSGISPDEAVRQRMKANPKLASTRYEPPSDPCVLPKALLVSLPPRRSRIQTANLRAFQYSSRELHRASLLQALRLQSHIPTQLYDPLSSPNYKTYSLNLSRPKSFNHIPSKFTPHPLKTTFHTSLISTQHIFPITLPPPKTPNILYFLPLTLNYLSLSY